MCHFVSWTEKMNQIFFLTNNDVFETKRGRELQEFTKDSRDLVGHGAIEFLYPESKGGKHMECEDFSSPENFPVEIAKALKEGRLARLGQPVDMLTPEAWAECQKVCDLARAECRKVCDLAQGECEKVRTQARAECDKVRKTALAEFEKVCKTAWAEYKKACASAFLALVVDEKNRAEAWK